MKTSQSKAILGAVAVLLAGASVPALSQDAPESLLPPGFGDPVEPAATPTPGAPAARPDVGPAIGPRPAPTPTPSPSATPDPALAALAAGRYNMPDFARRSLTQVGPVTSSDGLSPDAFGGADGRYLRGLMRRLDAPVASRWLSIALRRALVSSVTTPGNVNGADFAAERAWLLIRMGEAQAARALVQSVDAENYTPKMLQVAMQAALATADPAALCPLVTPEPVTGEEPSWTLARAICASLSGEPSAAGAQIDRARRQRVAGGIDLLLAEKVVGAGGGRRSVTIEWDGVERLTAWRYGMATATAVAIPSHLLDQAGPQVRVWQALSPIVDPEARLASAMAAARIGALSNAALVDLFGAVGDAEDRSETESGIARELRVAYVEADSNERIEALRGLWAQGSGDRYGWLVLTARAAARITPVAAYVGDADLLVASMLTAGLDAAAARWREIVPETSAAWAMIALTDPGATAAITYAQVDNFKDSDASTGRAKAAMLAAGLAGLGRVSADDAEALARDMAIPIGVATPWTRAIEAAAARGQPATVLLLAGVGMQTPDWRGVPAASLYHIVSALRRVGLEGEARMIAAEAVARS